MLRVAIAGVFAVLLASGIGHLCLDWDALSRLDWLPGCPFRLLTDMECPGCGMTRALLLLSQIRVAEAVATHPVAPLLLAAMAWRLVAAPRGRHSSRAFSSNREVRC